MADFGYRPRIRLVDVKRRVEGLCNPVTGRRGLVMVVQVLARDAAEVGNGLYVLLEGGCPVDEQVARFALEQESADLQRGSEPQGLGHRGVQPGYDGFHEWISLFSTSADSIARLDDEPCISMVYGPSIHCEFAPIWTSYGPAALRRQSGRGSGPALSPGKRQRRERRRGCTGGLSPPIQTLLGPPGTPR